jgi:uncharacterized protein involved in outer membrane biogenesis
MREYFRAHPKSTVAGIAALVIVAGLVLAVSLFDWNRLRAPLARRITAQTGRPAAIDGDLKVHLWSWNPSAEVDGLRLANPDWAERSTMFGAKRILVSVSLLRLLRGQLVLPEVSLVEPVINLERDAKGRASWELGTPSGVPNHRTAPAKLPTIRRLDIEGGKLHVLDEIRKLTFSGSLVAGEEAGRDNASAFKIRCNGTLNAKPFTLAADGGPLLNLEPTKPYSFAARLTASDIALDAHVTVRKPFDLSGLDVKFVVSGDDLADVFYLTGLALPNTPKYRLGATVHVDGSRFKINDLQGTLGSSDLSGTMEVQTAAARPRLTARLVSNKLDLADLAPTLGQRVPKSDRLSAAPPPRRPGKPATDTAAGTAAPANGGRLLPDADLQVKRVRGMDADVTYRAASVQVPKVPVREFNLHLVLDNGILTIDPLAFALEQGKFTGRVRIDAQRDDPVSDVDMHIEGIDLGEFKSATMKEAPLDGNLLGRFKFHGTGTSVHKFAASSDGDMSVVIPSGQISDAIAELTGINVLQGLGLLLTKDQKKTDIRCGIIDFKDHDGRLDTTTVFVDTSNVLITGRGDIDLADEDIDLALQGDPKKLRLLRLRSPIELGGTLLHPTVGVKVGKLAEQAGVAAALGTLLTPAAAVLAFVDPGLAKSKDCSTVLQQARAGVAAAPPPRTGRTGADVGAVSPPVAERSAAPPAGTGG